MRINLNQPAQPLPESERTANQSAGSSESRAAASNAPGEDQAQLSGTYLQAQTLTAEALQFPEVREEKVNALRQVVEAGTYRPTSSQVAGALVNHMLVKPAA